MMYVPKTDFKNLCDRQLLPTINHTGMAAEQSAYSEGSTLDRLDLLNLSVLS